MFGGLSVTTIFAMTDLILRVVPKILELIRSAEEIFKGAKKGKIKKMYVMNGIENLISVGEITLLPELKDRKSEFLSAVSDFIDALVRIINSAKIHPNVSYEIDVSPVTKEEHGDA